MPKTLQSLTKAELDAVKIIAKNQVISTKFIMDIKKNPEYQDAIVEMRTQLAKEKAFRDMIKREMQSYRSPTTPIKRKFNSLSQRAKYHSIQSYRSSNHHLNSQQYNEYDKQYKLHISPRSKSISRSTANHNMVNIEENQEDIIDKLIMYMDNYFYPGNVIRYLSLLDERYRDYKETFNCNRFRDSDQYCCGSIHNNIFLYNFLDLVDVKCLFICYHNGKHYLSPLNDRRFKDFIQKPDNLPYDFMLDTNANIKDRYAEMIQKCLISVASKFGKVYHNLVIPCELYDVVIKHNMFQFDFEIDSAIEVKLSGITNKNFVSSIINNREHSIAIVKCNKKNILMHHFKTKGDQSIRIYDYVPLFNQYFHLKLDLFSNIDHNMHRVDLKDYDGDVAYLYNSKFYNGLSKSIYAYTGDNLHFFSNRHSIRKRKTYATVLGGAIDCPNMYIPENTKGFCWYASIISALLYADELCIVMLNKSIRYITKAVQMMRKYGSEFASIKQQTLVDYASFDKDKNNIINMMVYVNIFVYTSYAVIMKNKISEINNAEKWLKTLDFIFANEDMIKKWNNDLLQITRVISKSRK